MARGGLSHTEAQFSCIPLYAPLFCSWSLPLSFPRWSLYMWLRGKRTSCWKWYLGTMSQGTWEGRKKQECLGTQSPQKQALPQPTLCTDAAQLEMGGNIFKCQSLELQANVFYTRLREGSFSTERAVFCKDIQPGSSAICQSEALSMLLI